MEKFIVGKSYRFSEIPQEDTDDLTVSEYGLEYLGQHAIHLRYHDTTTDIWFVWDGMANESIFKCTYKN